MSKAQKKRDERDAAIATLTRVIREDAAVDERGRPMIYFVTRSVADSGMSRVFAAYYIKVDGTRNGVADLLCLNYLLPVAAGYSTTRDGFRISGGGMDMRFAVADDIARLVGLDSGNDIAIASL